MADTSRFSEFGGELVNRLLSGTIVVFLVLIMGGVILTVALVVRYLRQFNIKVRIKTKRSSGGGGEPIYKILYDKGGFIYKNKDKTSWFRIRGEKVDLPKPPFDVMQVLANGGNEIEILKVNDDTYYYLIPSSINQKVVVRDGIEYPSSQVEMKIIEGDVAYWSQIRKRHNRTLFDMEGAFMKILPYAGLLIMFMAVIFLTYIMTDHWGSFDAAAQALKEGAMALRDATTAQAAIG